MITLNDAGHGGGNHNHGDGAKLPFVASRNRKAFFRTLSKREKKLRDKRIPRKSLHEDPQKSSWGKLYESGVDQSMVTLTGFDYEIYHLLIQKFA